MATLERFCLRWNDFESNLSSSFREIRDDGEFLDVTLSVGDQQIQAHKLVLSACSPFFRTVLKQNPHQHPLLYLKGVTLVDLQAVLDFMYHGEVSLAQESLNSFLAVAEELRVKGLSQNRHAPNGSVATPAPPVRNHSDQQFSGGRSAGGGVGSASAMSAGKKSEHKMSSRSAPKDLNELDTPPAKKHKSSTFTPSYTSVESFSRGKKQPVEVEEDDIAEVLPIKQEPGGLAHHDIDNHDQSFAAKGDGTVAEVDNYAEEFDYPNFDATEGDDYDAGVLIEDEGDQSKEFREADSFIQSNSCQLPGNGYQCQLCLKEVRSKGNLIQHMEVNHLPREPRYPCRQCGNLFVTRRKLASHKSKECPQFTARC